MTRRRRPHTSTPLSRALGNVLRHGRHDLGLSENELADLAGISRTALNSLERGVTISALTHLARLAAVQRCDVSALLLAAERQALLDELDPVPMGDSPWIFLLPLHPWIELEPEA